MSASIPAPAKAFYIYIDEAGDEGMPSPHTNALLYRDRPSNRSGPSPYFIIGGVLIEDTKRTAALKIMHEIASQLFRIPSTQKYTGGSWITRKRTTLYHALLT